MTMHDTARVLSAKSATFSDADRIAAWCAENPPGYVYLGDWAAGTAALSPGDLDVVALGLMVRAQCWRRGIDCRIGWGFRPDVVSPRLHARAKAADPTLRAEWVAPGLFGLDTAQAGWPDDWRFALKGNVDPGWWADAIREEPMAAAYAFAFPGESRVEIVGALADITSPSYRDWVVAHAAQVLAWLQADWLLVGIKGWERRGQPYMTPSNLNSSNLLQPPSIDSGQWAYAISDLLVGLTGFATVLTLTKPTQPPHALMLGGTAVERVVAEADLEMFA